MQSPKRLKITDVNPHLLCVLCGGYYIDATTIIECLHSFCKTCIVHYLESNKYCPICDVQIHKSYPLQNIRTDKTLQDIVYKLVPSLFQNEMRRRVEFYSRHPEGPLPSDPELRGEVGEHSTILLPDEPISICLDYLNSSVEHHGGKRFLHCPAAVTISHLQKLIKGKFSLSPDHQVNIFYKDDHLGDNLTLMDVAYIYQWRRKGPIHLSYQILEIKRKRVKVSSPLLPPPLEKSEDKEAKEDKPVDKEWKEVQLQISENGVMSVRDISGSECSPMGGAEETPVSNNGKSTPSPGPPLPAPPPLPPPPPSTITTCVPSPSTQVSTCTTTTTTTTTSIVAATPHETHTSRDPIVSVSKVSKEQATMKKPNILEVNNLSISRVPPGGLVREKGDVLNWIVSKLSPDERMIGNTSVTIRPVTAPKVYPGIKPHQEVSSLPKEPIPRPVEKKPVQQFKYKTLKTPTKPWNPSIDRSTMLSMKQHQNSDQNTEQAKAPRFFKMRNMPRYLGNPASGVKPMFQIGGESEPPPPQPSKQRPTLTKVDAKTLSPIGPVSSIPRSPTKMPPPFTPGSPKRSPNPYMAPPPNSFPRVPPSPAHTGSPPAHGLALSPYLLYSGFPFPTGDSSRLLAPELLRSMCNSAAFHPSLPPSISMLFNPLHTMQRPNQDGFKIDSRNNPSPPPTVQRIPPTNVSKSDILTPKSSPNNNNNNSTNNNNNNNRSIEERKILDKEEVKKDTGATTQPPLVNDKSKTETKEHVEPPGISSVDKLPSASENIEKASESKVSSETVMDKSDNNNKSGLELGNKLEEIKHVTPEQIPVNNNVPKETPVNNSESLTPAK